MRIERGRITELRKSGRTNMTEVEGGRVALDGKGSDGGGRPMDARRNAQLGPEK